MFRYIVILVAIQLAFSGIYLTVSDEFAPKIDSFSDSFYYSLQTISRVGDGQFTATGEAARIWTAIQIFMEMIWMVMVIRLN